MGNQGCPYLARLCLMRKRAGGYFLSHDENEKINMYEDGMDWNISLDKVSSLLQIIWIRIRIWIRWKDEMIKSTVFTISQKLWYYSNKNDATWKMLKQQKMKRETINFDQLRLASLRRNRFCQTATNRKSHLSMIMMIIPMWKSMILANPLRTVRLLFDPALPKIVTTARRVHSSAHAIIVTSFLHMTAKSPFR